MGDQSTTPVSHELCDERSGQVLVALTELKISVDTLNKRLVVDNGSLSIQTRLDRHDVIVGATRAAIFQIRGILITAGVALLIFAVRHFFFRG